MNKGKLVIVSGFSGVGKGTVIKALMEQYPGEYAFSVSATTRSPREGEVNGREYYFVSTEEFEAMIGRGEFLEYARYQGNYYGTPLKPILERTEAGENILLDIEVQGANQVKAAHPEVATVFLIPPTAEILYRRLAGRGTETEEQVMGRIRRAYEESAIVGDYDYILTNDVLADTVDALRAITLGQTDPDRDHAAGTAELARIREELERILNR